MGLKKSGKSYSKLATIGVLLISPMGVNTYAAAFALNEQNTSGLGNAYAGRTAIAEDASTSFYNPAGLVRMHHHQALASLVNPLAKFDVKMHAATRSTGAPLLSGDPTENAGKYVPLPAVHFAGHLMDQWFYGLSVTAPFGLATEYGKNSRFRYFATLSEVKVVDVNPNLAYKLNNQWSFGAGVSMQYVKATLSRQVDQSFLPSADGQAKNIGDSYGYGYNFGALYQPTEATRVGLAFRSKVKHNLDGDIKFKNINPILAIGAGARNQDLKTSVTLPEVLSISAFQTLNSDWDIMGDLTYTNWHRFKKLVIKYPDTNLATVRVEERFKDSFKVAVGANFKYNSHLTWKFGTAFDQSPVETSHRTFRVPDSDRWWLSTGFKYNFDRCTALDVGYSYLFVDHARIRETPIAAAPFNLATSNASSKSSINLIGVQLTYNM